MTWTAIRIVAFVALTMVAVLAGPNPQAVTDEKLRQAALRAVFPQMKVSVEPARKIHEKRTTKPDRPSFPDALSNEATYRVTGPAANEAERCASKDLLTGSFSEDREVRLKVFHWPGNADTELLVLTQYKFPKAKPAGSCWSIGLLSHLALTYGTWHPRQAYLLQAHHHSSIQRMELIDLTGTGLPELVVESDFGGPGTVGSSLQVFSLANGRFDEILNTQSRLEAGTDEGYAQALDVAGTRAEKGKRFRVTRTTYFENGTWLNRSRISQHVYERGFGVDQDSRPLNGP